MQKLKNNEARPKFTGSNKKKACMMYSLPRYFQLRLFYDYQLQFIIHTLEFG